jgi:DNA-binding beta-propeller fold protein YncE
LNKPTGIAIDKDNKIYVTGDSVILVLSTEGKLISRFNIPQSAGCIAISADNQIYLGVSDHIEVYNPDGILSASWKRMGKESYITSVVLKSDFVYVADAGEEYIYQFNKKGDLLKTIGTKDTTDQMLRFIIPSMYFDVAIDPEGFLWVVNPGRHLLINLKDNGELRSYWGQTSMTQEGFCGCCNPTHIAIMNDGSFITSEKGIVRVKKYDSAGNFMCILAGPEEFMEDSKDLDIAIDSHQKIYILEPYSKKIHVFEN